MKTQMDMCFQQLSVSNNVHKVDTQIGREVISSYNFYNIKQKI
jgi:hypothetical protein